MSSLPTQSLPPPVLRGVSPNGATLGAGATVFQLSGAGFSPQARVRVHVVNAKPDMTLSPTSVTSETIQVTVPASFFELQGSFLGFSVENPASPLPSPLPPPPVASNEVVIEVYAPTIVEINPTAVAANQPATIVILATHILDAPDGSRRTDALLDRALLPRTDSTINLAKDQITVLLPGASLTPGTHTLQIVNAIPNPPGGYSNVVYLQAS